MDVSLQAHCRVAPHLLGLAVFVAMIREHPHCCVTYRVLPPAQVGEASLLVSIDHLLDEHLGMDAGIMSVLPRFGHVPGLLPAVE